MGPAIFNSGFPSLIGARTICADGVALPKGGDCRRHRVEARGSARSFACLGLTGAMCAGIVRSPASVVEAEMPPNCECWLGDPTVLMW